MMRSSACILFIVAVTSLLLSCSTTVASEEVYGTYVADYPFGVETITLKADGSLVQSFVLWQDQPVMIEGAWSFDPQNSLGNFYGVMVVTAGVGHLRSDWRIRTPWIVSFEVETRLGKVVMRSGGAYPYTRRCNRTQDFSHPTPQPGMRLAMLLSHGTTTDGRNGVQKYDEFAR